MDASQNFAIFKRGDGSDVACQVSRVLFVTPSEHGCVLNFGAGTQLNIREEFDAVVAMLNDNGERDGG